MSRRVRAGLRLFATSHPLLTDTSIEAPPSLLPPRHYCDITGLEVRVARVASFRDTLSTSGPIHGSAHGAQVPRQERVRSHQEPRAFSIPSCGWT
jgi:hypothetical protein